MKEHEKGFSNKRLESLLQYSKSQRLSLPSLAYSFLVGERVSEEA